MNFVSRHFRLLLLLLLLQLLSGPIVLMSVVTLCKVAIKESVQHGFVAGTSRATESDEWHSVCDLIIEAVTVGKDATTPDGKLKGKDSNSKWIPVAWAPSNVLPEIVISNGPPDCAPVLLLSHWPHGPPTPPPRLA